MWLDNGFWVNSFQRGLDQKRAFRLQKWIWINKVPVGTELKNGFHRDHGCFSQQVFSRVWAFGTFHWVRINFGFHQDRWFSRLILGVFSMGSD